MPRGEGSLGREEMMRCKELARLIASDGLAEATWSRRVAVRFHLLMCRHCRLYHAQMRDLGRAARSLFRREDKGPDLNRLKSSILEQISEIETSSHEPEI